MKYYLLQLKRVFKIFPFVVIVIAVLAVAFLAVFSRFSAFMDEEQKNRFKIGWLARPTVTFLIWV